MKEKFHLNKTFLNKALKLINSKWCLLIIKELCSNKKLRFSQLKENLKINSRTLSNELKKLEKIGLIERKFYNQIPPKVEYCLTKKGKELKIILIYLQNWYKKWFK